MGITQAVSHKKTSFWAVDAALATWLLAFFDVAADHDLAGDPWWAEQLDKWEVDAIVGNVHVFTLPHDWQPAQREAFVELATTATAALREHDQLDSAELAARELQGTTTTANRYHSRRQTHVATEPIALLGDAIVALARGTLEPAPPGTWWYFGTDDGPKTIAMLDKTFD